MLRRSAFAVAAVLLVTGCVAHRIRYVALVDVPESPTMTVIPMSTSPADVNASDLITEVLIANGVRVLERPAFIREQTRYEGQGAGGVVGGGPGGFFGVSGKADHQAEMTASRDVVTLIDETKADYVVFVKAAAHAPWAKLIRRESGQVLFAGIVAGSTQFAGSVTDSWLWGAADAQEMRTILVKAGILR